jgi:hypothetical protein
MHQPAPHTEPATVPGCIAAILHVVRALLRYGRRLDATLPEHATHSRFPTLAAGFGTYDLRRIAAHIQRGLLRAMMLERFLLARAAQGHDIEPTPPPGPAEPAEIEALEIKLRAPSPSRSRPERRLSTDPDHPLNFTMPTLKQLEAQIRRRPIGQTIAEICLDLGINPHNCEGGFWNEVYQVLWHFGGSFEHFFSTHARRRKAFQKEWEKRPDTWTFDWRDRPGDAIRQILGYLLGEPPPDGPDPEPTAVPA